MNNFNENTQISESPSMSYFSRRSPEETMPIYPDEPTNQKYENLEKIFNHFFPEESTTIAKESSKEERDKKHLNDPSFVYGEITFRSFAYILEYIKSEFPNQIKEGNFYDLGSGTGKCVLAAALCHPFKKCIGIEFLESLYSISEDIKRVYNDKISQMFETSPSLFSQIEKPIDITFINEDFLKEKWVEPSIIFANSTCFPEDLMIKIGKKANKECPSGTIIITFTKRIPGLNTNWEYRDEFRRLMSWGIATVYIHKRK